MSGPEGGRRRVLPVLLACAGLLGAGAVLAWAVVGPEGEPVELDVGALGYAVDEREGTDPTLRATDPTAVFDRLRGWQGDIGGRLDLPLPAADGSWSATITDAMPGDEVGFERAVLGVVTWDGKGRGAGGVRACAFVEPVPLARVTAAVEDEHGDDVHVDLRQLAGRCDGDRPQLVAPLVEVRTPPLSVGERLRGRTARSTLVPAGVVVAGPDGRVALAAAAPSGLEGLLVYPREVAAESLERAAPGSLGQGDGDWLRPFHPLAAHLDGELVWVTPVSPPDADEVTMGYASIAATDVQEGRVAPVRVAWLAEPVAGYGAVVARVGALLEDLGEDPAATGGVWASPPDEAGNVTGHVAEPFRLAEDLPEVRYRVHGDAQHLCLTTTTGDEVACSGPS